MNCKVLIEVEVKISDEEFEKLEAEGTLADHLEVQARRRIEYNKGRVKFFNGKEEILKDVI